MTLPITIAIVEDDRHYNNALKKIIGFDEELSCIGQFFGSKEAIETLPTLNPNVVLMDINLPGVSGIEIVSTLKPMMEESHFIMCTSFEDDSSIFDAIKAGASGYLVKGESMERVISSIKECQAGGVPMTFGVANRVLQYFRQDSSKKTYLEELTKTENEVLEMLSKGLLYKEIADQKSVSIETIKKQTSSIYRKLHVNNKTEAINKLKTT